MMLSMPDASASSTPYWMIGLSTSGSISFGCAFVAGRKRVPSPAAGKTAFRIIPATWCPPVRLDQSAAGHRQLSIGFSRMIDPAVLRDHPDLVHTALSNRGADPDAILAPLVPLDERRRALIVEVESLKRE